MLGLRAEGGVANAATSAEEGGDEGPLPGLLELATSGDQTALEAQVEEHFAIMGPQEMSELQMQVAQDPSPTNPANLVAMAIQGSVQRRMASAKDLILELLENPSGNVIADVRMTLKKAENPLPLLMVLQINIQQAQEEQDEDKIKALTHIYTLINEEMEKKVSKVQGLLNKLLRMEDPNIRENILRHHLQPAPVAAAAPGLDDFDDEPAAPTLTAALVPPGRLATAIAQLVANVDQSLRATLGEDDSGRFETLEKIREVAKDARRIIGDIYGEAEMNAFSTELTPTFHTLMAYRAKMEPPAERPVEMSPAELAATRGNAPQVSTKAAGSQPPQPGPTAPMPQ